MKSMTHRALTAAAPPGAGMLSRSRPLAALLAAGWRWASPGNCPTPPAPMPPDRRPTCASVTPSGTSLVPGSAAGEDREVDVHLWYPADQQGLTDRPKAVYQSALWGRPLPAPLVPAFLGGRGRDRARGRADRSARPSPSRDRVLARFDQRSDRLCPHVGADRRRRLRGRRALPRQQHPGRRADRLHQPGSSQIQRSPDLDRRICL